MLEFWYNFTFLAHFGNFGTILYFGTIWHFQHNLAFLAQSGLIWLYLICLWCHLSLDCFWHNSAFLAQFGIFGTNWYIWHNLAFLAQFVIFGTIWYIWHFWHNSAFLAQIGIFGTKWFHLSWFHLSWSHLTGLICQGNTSGSLILIFVCVCVLVNKKASNCLKARMGSQGLLSRYKSVDSQNLYIFLLRANQGEFCDRFCLSI